MLLVKCTSFDFPFDLPKSVLGLNFFFLLLLFHLGFPVFFALCLCRSWTESWMFLVLFSSTSHTPYTLTATSLIIITRIRASFFTHLLPDCQLSMELIMDLFKSQLTLSFYPLPSSAHKIWTPLNPGNHFLPAVFSFDPPHDSIQHIKKIKIFVYSKMN